MDYFNSTDFDFSEEEILNELNRLGYYNVPQAKLKEFQRDLKVLIQQDKSASYNTSVSSSHYHDDSTDHEAGPPMKVTISTDRSCRDEDLAEETKENLIVINGKNENQNSHTEMKLGKNKKSLRSQPPPPKQANFSLYNQSDIADDVSEADSELKRLVKRKTVRKNEKGNKFIDESMTESDTASILDAHERLQRLALRDFDDMQIDRRPRSSYTYDKEPPYRLAPDDNRPPSVILRGLEHPHTKNLRKSDPVARYQQFRQAWQCYRAPGEKDHKNLRWNIREKMLAQEVPEKKNHRVYVQNKYVIPSEKQRKNLRWQVRMDMAQGVKPPCGFFHEY